MAEKHCVLLHHEAEAFVESLQTVDLAEIGSQKWLSQHERLYKLSIQATLNAQGKEEEFVKDLIVTCGKIPVIIHELLAIELWKENVLPVLIKLNSAPSSIVPLYTACYHEAIIASLLATMLYHEDVIESSSEVLIDIIDFCHRKIITLMNLSSDNDERGKTLAGRNELNELFEKNNAINFEIQMKCISFLSCIIQHIKIIPLSCLHRLLTVHDIPMLFTSLITNSPWIRKSANGNTEKYSEGKWEKVNYKLTHKLSKVEGQVWFSVILLLLNADCLRKYEINEYRKNRLLQLKSYITEVLIQQIPIFQDFLTFLEKLILCDPPHSRPDIIIEQFSEIREALLRKHQKNWKSIAKQQMTEFFSPSGPELGDMCKRLCNAYDMDSIEAVLPDIPKCATCYEAGSKKCSRCKNEWYCGRKCQVAHWKKHKSVCDIIAQQTSKE